VSDLATSSPALELAALFEQLGVGGVSLADVLRLDRDALAQLVDRALALAAAGRADAAEALLVRLVQVDAASAMLPYLLGAVRAEAGRHAEALEACQEALRRDAARAETAAFRAEVLLLLGRTQLSLHDAEAARATLEAAAAVDAPARGQAQAILQGMGGRDAGPARP
jgi:predicted Zn-dependent protease